MEMEVAGAIPSSRQVDAYLGMLAFDEAWFHEAERHADGVGIEASPLTSR